MSVPVEFWNPGFVPHAALQVLADSGRPLAIRLSDPWLGRVYASDQFMRHLQPGDRGVRRAWALGVRGRSR